MDFIRKHGYDLEVYLSAADLDALGSSGISELKGLLDYNPSLSIHAPYMDLSPGAVDRKVREATRERFLRVFDVAEALGPRAIVFHSGYEKWRYAHRVDIWLEGSLRMWPEFLKMAGSIGTMIAIENVFEDEPRGLRLLLEGLASDRVGVCLDTGHFNIFSKEPLSVWLRELGPHIVELHLHDNLRDYDSHLAVGDGTFDFRELFRALKGRDVLCTVEAHTPEDIVKSIRRLKEYREI
jgi:sugar phosphate isomerase/epimerase